MNFFDVGIFVNLKNNFSFGFGTQLLWQSKFAILSFTVSFLELHFDDQWAVPKKQSTKISIVFLVDSQLKKNSKIVGK